MNHYYTARYCFIIEKSGSKLNFSTSPQDINTIPSWWMLNWTLDGTKEREDFCERYDFSKSKMDDLCKEITALFDEDKIGYPNVIFDLETAFRLYSIFLKDIKGLKLYSFGLEEADCNRLIDYTMPQDEREGEPGVRKMLVRRVSYKSEDILGYSVLGFDLGYFYSYEEFSLIEIVLSKFDCKRNSYGLITSQRCAKKISDFYNEYETEEISLWQPWLIKELDVGSLSPN